MNARATEATFQQLSYKAKVFEWRKRDDFLHYWRELHQKRRS